MKSKIVILCSLLLIFGQSLAYGQSKSKGKDKYEKDFVASIDSMQVVIVSLQSQLSDMDSIALNNIRAIDSLRNLSYGYDRRIDYLRDSLTREISNRDKEIAELQAYIGFVDTCMVKLANRWLYEKFDKERVKEAISYFDRIYDSRLKEDLSIVQKLLRNYESSYMEFQSILRQAQGDIERTSPFGVEKYKERYISKIQSMTYYIMYYENDWNIRYLNEKINDALDRLQNHSDIKFADFSSLID